MHYYQPVYEFYDFNTGDYIGSVIPEGEYYEIVVECLIPRKPDRDSTLPDHTLIAFVRKLNDEQISLLQNLPH